MIRNSKPSSINWCHDVILQDGGSSSSSHTESIKPFFSHPTSVFSPVRTTYVLFQRPGTALRARLLILDTHVLLVNSLERNSNYAGLARLLRDGDRSQCCHSNSGNARSFPSRLAGKYLFCYGFLRQASPTLTSKSDHLPESGAVSLHLCQIIVQQYLEDSVAATNSVVITAGISCLDVYS